MLVLTLQFFNIYFFLLFIHYNYKLNSAKYDPKNRRFCDYMIIFVAHYNSTLFQSSNEYDKISNSNNDRGISVISIHTAN